MSYLGPVSNNQDGTIINYIPYGRIENNTTRGWSACTLTWSGTTPSGAPTLTATQMAISASSSDPLSNLYSLLLTKSAANAQYQGFVSDAFTIKREDLAKVLTGSFYYEVASGTVDMSGTSTQSLEIWVYNVTANQWIQPAGYRGLNQSSGPGLVTFTFQTDSTPANNSYRIAVITQQTAATAYTVKFDTFKLSPQTAPIGPVVTDWVSYTPTIANLNAGTAPSQFYRWRRIGDSIQILGNVTAGGTGIGASGQVSFTIPSGLSFDTSKLAIISETTIGTGSIHDSGSARLPCSVNVRDSTSFHLVVRSNAATGGNIVSNTEPSAGWFNAAGDSISFELMAPISGWSSNVQLSNDTDTRVVAFAANKTAAQSIPNNSYTVIDFNSVEINTHGSTYAAGAYTAPVSGYYRVGFNFNFASGSGGTIFALLNKNGAGFSRISTQPFATSQSGGTGTTVLYLNAGENVSLSVIQLSGAAQNLEGAGRFSVERISGPSVIAASETVACRYNLTSFASPVNSSFNSPPFNQKVFDTHNMAIGVGTTSFQVTIPSPGLYHVCYGAGIGATKSGVSESYSLFLSGSVSGTFARGTLPPGSVSGQVSSSTVSSLIRLNQGEVVYFTFYSFRTDTTVSSYETSSTFASIVRVGL